MTSAKLLLPAQVAAAIRAALPTVAERTVTAVVVEVPPYADAFSGTMGRRIEHAVQLALAGFLELAMEADCADASTPIRPQLDGAYELGRGEVRDGRTVDVLLAAYRVGARTVWRELSAVAVAHGLGGEPLARLAELMFTYIDQLSAETAAGHADELAATGLVRRRHRERLARHLLAGATPEELAAAAERADWPPPSSLTAVVVPDDGARRVLARLDPRTLQLSDDLPPLDADGLTVLLVPDADGRFRPGLLAALAGSAAVVGPPRPWTRVQQSFRRAVRTLELGLDALPPAALDTEERLAELVVRADPGALADLRARVLAPLAGLRPAAREKLTETLRSWLLHHGRRDEVAADLFVHPQTIRYRLGQLRELYGAGLEDPRTVFELTVALGPLAAHDLGRRLGPDGAAATV